MSDKAAASGKERKPRQMPSSFTILFGCLLLVGIASWVVSSFSPDVQAATLGNFMASPSWASRAQCKSACSFLCSAVLGVVQKRAHFDTGIAVLVRRLGGNDLLLVPVLMLAFGICIHIRHARGIRPLLPAPGIGHVCHGLGSARRMHGRPDGLRPWRFGVDGQPVFDRTRTRRSRRPASPMTRDSRWYRPGHVRHRRDFGHHFVMRYAAVRADRAASSLTPEEWKIAEHLYGDKDGDSAENAHIELSKIQKRVLILFALTFVVMIIGFIPWQTFGVGLFDIGATGDDLSTAWSALLTGLPLGQWYFYRNAASGSSR